MGVLFVEGTVIGPAGKQKRLKFLREQAPELRRVLQDANREWRYEDGERLQAA
jgi:hypothetical protein